MSRLDARVISLEQARAERRGNSHAERDAATSSFFHRVAAQSPHSAHGQDADADRRAAALIAYLNNGGGGDEAA
jgi:hypothetical protein